MINAIEEMTIFNAITGPDRRESYFPTRIYGISWYENSGVSGADGYKKSQDAYAIRIPYTAHIQDNRTFLPPEEYRRLPLEKIPKHWTIQEGDYIFPKLMYPKRWRWDDFSFRTGMIVPEWNDIEAGIYYGKKWRWDPFSFRYGRITASPISDVGVFLNKKYGKMIKVTGYADNTKRGSPRVRHWKVGAA